jgi:predicted Holliday junction resolvase-like endonuclease
VKELDLLLIRITCIAVLIYVIGWRTVGNIILLVLVVLAVLSVLYLPILIRDVRANIAGEDRLRFERMKEQAELDYDFSVNERKERERQEQELKERKKRKDDERQLDQWMKGNI